MRATARGFEVAPNTGLHWLVEAAAQLRAFSAYFLCNLHLEQLPLDALYAVLRARKAGAIREAEALKRLERAPYWVWTAMDPTSPLLVVDVGCRTLALAQRVGHQVSGVLAPGCVPLLLTDGLKATAPRCRPILAPGCTPNGVRTKAPCPSRGGGRCPRCSTPRWSSPIGAGASWGARTAWCAATQLAIAPGLAAWGWTINTAFIERLHLDRRQRVAAVGRRVNPLCRGEAGLLDQMVWGQPYHNFVVPHASLRQPLPVAEATNGGSAKGWRPWTPAMAAGLTDHGWALTEVLCYRVPPWPQPQTV